MADNQEVSNNYASTVPNFKALSKEMVVGALRPQLQYVGIDISSTTTPSPVNNANPFPIGPSTFSTTTTSSTNVTTSASVQTIANANSSRKFGSLLLLGTAGIVLIRLNSLAASSSTAWGALVNTYDQLPLPDGYTGAITAISLTGTNQVIFCEG